MISEYILDTSVILKWILCDASEPDQEKAMLLLKAWTAGTVNISAPSLWRYEVGNFLGRELPEEAEEKMKLLLNLNIRTMELSEAEYQLCFKWMKENKVTFYDASYLAVAYRLQATPVTADSQFIKKMGETEHLSLLKDIQI